MSIITVPTTALAIGDVILTHGVELRLARSSTWIDACGREVCSFTTTYVSGDCYDVRADKEMKADRWIIQGNSLVNWHVVSR
jgi:hypothetical protein